ncbi:probable phosphomannomutase [Actinomycetota bacterium]|nr:probable phosphomannomutase [Actinomycetota bacterium]
MPSTWHLAYAKENDADLVIANDPDADRCAVAINDPAHGWRMLRGDEVGRSAGHYLITKNSVTWSSNCYSLVSSSLLGKIAKKHGLEFKETLTGLSGFLKLKAFYLVMKRRLVTALMQQCE